jgi:hypothetical protein
MATDKPEIRAAWCKFAIRTLKQQSGAMGELLRHQLPSSLRREIREAPRMGWCDLRVFMELCEFLVTTLDMTGARTFWHECLRGSIDQSLMGPLVKSGLFMFGKTPGALIKRTPFAWTIVARGCGFMSAHDGPEPNQILYEVDEMPLELRRAAFLPVVEGGFLAQIHYLRCQGSVLSDDSRLPLGRLRCDIRWRAQESGE